MLAVNAGTDLIMLPDMLDEVVPKPLFKAANETLYQAKHTGPNLFEVPESKTLSQELMQVMDCIKHSDKGRVCLAAEGTRQGCQMK